MGAVVFSGILSAFLMYLIYHHVLRYKDNSLKNDSIVSFGFMLVFFFAAVLRIYFGITEPGYETDIGCFQGWSSAVYEHGLSKFYKLDMFSDYPPGYMYVLWVIGFVKSLIGEKLILVKLPAIILDLIAGVMIFRVACKRFSAKKATFLSGMFLLSPAVILNSSIWGQVDIVYTAIIALSIYFLYRKMLLPAYLAFAVAVLVKPQALIFTPVFLYEFIDNYIKTRNIKSLVYRLIFALLSAGLLVILALPFGIDEVFKQYELTLESYPYATVNAFNIFGAFNLNWDGLTPLYSWIGTAGIIFSVLYTAFCFIKGNRNYFFLAGALVFMVYMLSTKMHERYAYPAMLLFLLAYITEPRRESIYLFMMTTFSQMINTAFVLFVAQTDINYYAKSPFIIVFSIVNILILGYMLYAGVKLSKQASKKDIMSLPERKYKFCVRFKTREVRKFKKLDYVLVISLTALYGIISFINLGETKAPQTYADIAETPVVVEFDRVTYVDKLIVYNSCNDLNEDRILEVTCVTPEGEETIQYTDANPFKWEFLDFGKEVSSITIGTENERIMLMEVGFLGEDGLIEVTSESSLFDEQELIPDRATYLNGTYFDEIYHARTGYEFSNGFDVYEWTHPPLGKVFISAGINLFGMTPFGWRIAGNLFGIMMVPLMYIFARRMFSKTFIAFFTTVLFTFDFMHFAQTRIATIDVYGTFFIILMYIFMYRYYQMSFYDCSLRKTFVPLLLTGIAFGLGAASKWTAIYACMGIAVLFFGIMYKRYYEYREQGIDIFIRKFAATCIFCVLAFIIIPVLIYMISYIPYLNTENTDGLRTIIQNQTDMYVYHSDTVVSSEHPYASKWYTWLLMIRPIFYYSGDTANGLKEGISAFGNPAVWWLGLIAVFFNIYIAATKKDRKAIFLLVGYFSCLIPWIPIERTTFIYHYFPCVPFMTMMIGRTYEYIYYLNVKVAKRGFLVHVIAAVILFAMFYPVISGHPVSEFYVDTFLKWLRGSWTLVL